MVQQILTPDADLIAGTIVFQPFESIVSADKTVAGMPASFFLSKDMGDYLRGPMPIISGKHQLSPKETLLNL